MIGLWIIREEFDKRLEAVIIKLYGG